MIILCTGSRDLKDEGLVYRQLCKFRPDTVIIHGKCRGADMLADKVAKSLGFTVRDYPVLPEEWDRLGLAAGPIRNKRMLDSEAIDLVLAFHISKSLGKGTKDMIEQVKERHIPYFIFV